MALCGRDRDRVDLGDVGERDAGLGEQAVFDVDHDLALDQQVVIEGECVLGEVDHPLDRVLDRNDTDVDLALLDGIEHVGNRSIGDVLGLGEVGLREQGLLGERAEGPEEPHPFRRARCHRSQDYGRRRRHRCSTVAGRSVVAEPTWHDERVDELGLRALLDDVQSGAVSPDDAVARLRRLPFADVEGATVDHHRHLRPGSPRRSTDRARARRSAWRSSASSSPTAPARCC